MRKSTSTEHIRRQIALAHQFGRDFPLHRPPCVDEARLAAALEAEGEVKARASVNSFVESAALLAAR